MRVFLFIIICLPVVLLMNTSAFAQGNSTQTYLDIVLGPDPSQGLSALLGQQFDEAYVRTMYQLNSDIREIAAFAESRAADSSIRRFSENIRKQRMDMNRNLNSFSPQPAPGPAPQNGGTRADEIINWLSHFSYSRLYDTDYRHESYIYSEFDRRYVDTMIALMQRSQNVSNLARTKASSQPLRNLAASIARSNERDIEAFRLWQRIGFLTPGELWIYCQNLTFESDIRCPRGPLGRGPLFFRFHRYRSL